MSALTNLVSLRLCAFALSLFLATTIHAATATDRLHDFFKNVQSLRADFTQTVSDTRMKTLQDAKGTFVMQRPNKFRWNYVKPYEQVIVADGAKLWLYDKDLEQVTVKSLDSGLGNTPALLLSGSRPLEETFHVSEVAGSNDGLQWIELSPKDADSSFTRVRLAFGAQSLEVMELTDSFGQVTRLRFSEVQLNKKFPADEFKFTPPKGVDVIEDAPKKK